MMTTCVYCHNAHARDLPQKPYAGARYHGNAVLGLQRVNINIRLSREEVPTLQ